MLEGALIRQAQHPASITDRVTARKCRPVGPPGSRGGPAQVASVVPGSAASFGDGVPQISWPRPTGRRWPGGVVVTNPAVGEQRRHQETNRLTHWRRRPLLVPIRARLPTAVVAGAEVGADGQQAGAETAIRALRCVQFPTGSQSNFHLLVTVTPWPARASCMAPRASTHPQIQSAPLREPLRAALKRHDGDRLRGAEVTTGDRRLPHRGSACSQGIHVPNGVDARPPGRFLDRCHEAKSSHGQIGRTCKLPTGFGHRAPPSRFGPYQVAELRRR